MSTGCNKTCKYSGGWPAKKPEVSTLASAAKAAPLGNRVTVGGHAVLCGAIEVGDDVRISQCAVVRRDTASHLIVASQAMFTTSHLRSTPAQDEP